MRDPGNTTCGFVGTSAHAEDTRRLMAALAPEAVTVCVIGPTGCGKSVVARALHPPQRPGPLVRVAAPRLDDALVANELLGHAREAFTSAVRDRTGILEQAAGGTLFVDDADDLGDTAQGLLLDIAEHVEVRPLGASRGFLPNVRMVFGFRQDPAVLAASGTLRRDLFHRIHQERIVLLPLAEHAADIPVLAAHLLAREARVLDLPVPKAARAALAMLMAAPWPGNVRELDAELQRAFRRARWEDEIGAVRTLECRHFAAELVTQVRGGRGRRLHVSAEEMRVALEDAGGHHGEAARALGMATRTYWRKLREAGL